MGAPVTGGWLGWRAQSRVQPSVHERPSANARSGPEGDVAGVGRVKDVLAGVATDGRGGPGPASAGAWEAFKVNRPHY